MGDESREPAGKKPAAERRRAQRVPVEMWVEEIADDHRVFRRAGNLSQGGLHLDKTIPIPVGSAVKLRFTLPDDAAQVEVEGLIVAIDVDDELGMGVKFQNVPEAAATQIDRYLKRALTT